MSYNDSEPSNYSSIIEDQPGSQKKVDYKFVRLQQVEHELRENVLFKYGLYLALGVVVARLIIDFITLSSRNFLEIGIRAVQVLGYGYGLQGFYSRDRFLAQIEVFFCYISYVLLGYFMYFSIINQDWVALGFNVFIVLLNCLLLFLARRFSKNLEERHYLKKALGKK